jgi:hypothetical protein
MKITVEKKETIEVEINTPCYRKLESFFSTSYFKFDNQYDGFKYNGSISTNETFTNSSFTNITLGLGVSTIYKIKSNQDFRFGISLYNLNKVKESFYQIEIKRPVRINCNFSFNYFYEKHLINSSINIQKQNSYQENLIGMFDH